MKTILVDLIDTQDVYKGSGIYIRKVFLSLLRYVDENRIGFDVHFICTYDSRKKILYPDFEVKKLESNPRITLVDISKTTFVEICDRYSVNTVFLGFGQQIYYYNFIGVKSKVICVLHDIFDLEYEDTKLDAYIKLNKSFFKRCKSFIGEFLRILYRIIKKGRKHHSYKSHIDFFKENTNYTIVTVSSYSYHSLLHYLPFPKEKILVLWSPEKELPELKPIENVSLKKLIDSGARYILLVSANRELKNPVKTIKVFLNYKMNNPQEDLLLLTIGFGKSLSNDHIDLPYLNDVDIEYAYKFCYALIYPSFFEGFGYPPLEVMKYGKPVLSSNVCSMPEILGNSPIWFSPFYSTDIYKALFTLMNSDYDQLCKRAFEQYLVVSKRQKEDLDSLVKLILS